MTGERVCALLLPLLVAACSTGDARDCTLVGSQSVVAARSASPSVAVLRLCVDGDCDSPDGRDAFVLVEDTPATYEYTVTVSIDGAERDLSGSVETSEYFANGEGCGTPTANATITVAGDGEVNVTSP